MGWELRRQLRSPGRGCWDCCCCSMTEKIGADEGRGRRRKLADRREWNWECPSVPARFLDSWRLTRFEPRCPASADAGRDQIYSA